MTDEYVDNVHGLNVHRTVFLSHRYTASTSQSETKPEGVRVEAEARWVYSSGGVGI
jgi:hypothetical protein